MDPETARDHDDAISLDRLPGGGWRLAVHIADVAHYVRPGSPLDQEAYLRGTSVYFPDRVVPMLPHALSSGICSLVDNQDRLTQTVVLELDAKAKVRKAEFHDGVIRSRARMTYQQVQRIVDGDAELAAPVRPSRLPASSAWTSWPSSCDGGATSAARSTSTCPSPSWCWTPPAR